MPTWGLTADQRKFEPWGLHPELLKPSKVITDPIHGDIYTNVLEQAIIDTAPFQRLRRVRQLGTAHLVYPGATQSRFSHSLGALRVAQNLLDAITTQREGLHATPDLLEQWDFEGKAPKRIARVIVLARLGALLHDLCHLPFGHSIEDDLRLLPAHDEGGQRFEDAWEEVEDGVRNRISAIPTDGKAMNASLAELFDDDGGLLVELRPLIISKGEGVKDQGEMRYPFVADLVGNTICADLLDYLRRDHLYTGLPVSLGTRFTSAFFVTPDGSSPYAERMAINIIRDGHERTDVISELLKALRFRYELSERVITHHTKLAADAMVGKMLELLADATWLGKAQPLIERLPSDPDPLRDANLRALRSAVRDLNEEDAANVEVAVAGAIESALLQHGDDGLLERIAGMGRGGGDQPIEVAIRWRLKAAAELANAILERRLFKVGARVGANAAPASALFERYGEQPDRVALQEAAQRFAEIDARLPAILIWLPDPKMRVKEAEVLVDDGLHVNRFVDYERVRSGRGSDIYDAHERLWAISAFVNPALDPRQIEVALAYLARELGVCWERMEPKFGPDAADWVDRLALSRFTGLEPRDHELEKLLAKIVDTEPLAARNLDATSTFEDHVEIIASLPEARQLQERHQGS